MRILSLGFPLPGVALDNYSFASAPAFFDYDALIVDPRALSQLIDEVVQGTKEHTTRSGERVVAGPAGAGQIALADLLRDRRDETERLLARGGLVVCFARPGSAHEGLDHYGWLPAPEGTAYAEPFLRRGTGTEISVARDDHPFAPLLMQWRDKLTYQAYFDGKADVIARSAGGAAVAIELRAGAGTIVFLPTPARQPTGDQRYAFSEALQLGVRQTLRLPSKSRPPDWLAGYALPGLAAPQAGADTPVGGAETPGEASDGPDAALGGYQRLLWQEGRYGLEEAVRAAMVLLGFRVVPDDIDQPAQLHLEGQVALIEVEGGAGAVGMEAHYRLRRRLEEAIAQGRPKRGLLIINGHRTQDPASRAAQYTEPLRIAAETMRYCVATSVQLFHAVRAALDGDEASVRRFRERLLTTEGVMHDD